MRAKRPAQRAGRTDLVYFDLKLIGAAARAIPASTSAPILRNLRILAAAASLFMIRAPGPSNRCGRTGGHQRTVRGLPGMRVDLLPYNQAAGSSMTQATWQPDYDKRARSTSTPPSSDPASKGGVQ